MAKIVYNGIGFNKEWVKSMNAKEFAEHEKHHRLKPEQYKEIHDLCHGKVPKPAKEKEVIQVDEIEPPQE